MLEVVAIGRKNAGKDPDRGFILNPPFFKISVSLVVEISIVSREIGIVILLCCALSFGLLFGVPLAENLRKSQVSRIVVLDM